jgi:SAM-dependent methyltransferase
MSAGLHLLRSHCKRGRAAGMTTAQVPRIFDRRQFAAKMERARYRQHHCGGVRYLADTMAGDIAERLDFMRFAPPRALVVGDAGQTLLNHLDQNGSLPVQGLLGAFDEERPGPPEAFDLIVHLLGLGMVNDLPGALIHARGALAEGGLFLAAFPGAGSMPALRRIAMSADAERPAARMHPLVDNRAATGLLDRAGFTRQVVDSYPIEVRYPSLAQMLADLRDHGLTRSLTSPVPPLSRAWLARAEAAFDALRDGGDGKVTERFEILVLTAWRQSAACAAASRAIGTRKGDALT